MDYYEEGKAAKLAGKAESDVPKNLSFSNSQLWLLGYNASSSIPVQALNQEDIDKMNQEEHERPHKMTQQDWDDLEEEEDAFNREQFG